MKETRYEEVSINNGCANPGRVTLRKGDKVWWKSHDVTYLVTGLPAFFEEGNGPLLVPARKTSRVRTVREGASGKKDYMIRGEKECPMSGQAEIWIENR
ncbi:MAG: hypothetical protein IT158_08305 [Bryobacterales bacterium]|nr:hypothetical protein [Bryobacterales bacterium]